MAKTITVDATHLPVYDQEALNRASAWLDYHEHLETCPVYWKSSADCVWPIAVCAPEDWRS